MSTCLPLHCSMQHLLQLLRNTEEQQDQARADVATWLSSEGKFIDVAAVNADLDTCMHCAVKSSSPLTMQVSRATYSRWLACFRSDQASTVHCLWSTMTSMKCGCDIVDQASLYVVLIASHLALTFAHSIDRTLSSTCLYLPELL